MKKKHLFTIPLLIFGLVTQSILVSCGSEEATPEPADPTISVSVQDDNLNPLAGTSINITVQLEAEAGLSQLFLNGNSIKSFVGTEVSETVTHEQVIGSEDPITLNFSVEDARGIKVDAAPINLEPIENPAIGYLIVDFAGTSSGNEQKLVVDWDNRTKWTMGVSGNIGSSVTLENVAGQGKVSQFAAANPDPTESIKVLKYTKEEGETSTGPWGGWTNLIIGLEGKVPSEEISALPKYDKTNNALIAGTRVVALDVYYDTTVDQDFSWSDIANFSDVWNSDVSKGLKIDVVLGSYETHAVAEVGYDQKGYHISYSGYVTEPNKWVTVKFNLLDEGRTAFFYDNRDEENSSESVGSDMVDCFNLKVSPGYDAAGGGDNIDTNPVYFKNLRIINAE